MTDVLTEADCRSVCRVELGVRRDRAWAVGELGRVVTEPALSTGTDRETVPWRRDQDGPAHPGEAEAPYMVRPVVAKSKFP